MSSQPSDVGSNISVVIPLYNKAAYVGRAISSVLAQTVLPGRVIVVDDGSTDEGRDVVRRGFPTVQYVHKENQGEGAARNTGVDIAETDWVAFLDADDFWLPNHLAELQSTMSRFRSADLVSTSHAEWWIGSPFPSIRVAGSAKQVDYFRAASSNQGIVWSGVDPI